MSDRFIHTFDEWMTRVNKRLFRLERRLAPPGSGGGGEVPDPLTIGTINVTTLNVTGKATVPEPIDADDATTKGYVDAGDADTLAAANAHADAGDADTLAAANAHADAAAAAAQAAATQHLVAGSNVTVAGDGSAATPWVVSATGGGGQAPTLAPAGMIAPWAGTGPAPDGWLVANGAAVSRTAYANLFGAIGTTYGPGDGSSTFNLPDLRGRVSVGAGTQTPGTSGGASTHTHPLSDAGQARITMTATAAPNLYMRRVSVTDAYTATYQGALTGTPSSTSTASSTGAGLAGTTDAGSSMPPYLVTQYLISTGNGSAPAPTAWVDITPNSAYRPLGSVDLWQVRREGDMHAWSQALLVAVSTLTLTAGTQYVLGTLPPAFTQGASRRGVYTQVQIRGNVNTTALAYLAAGSATVSIIPNATVTLTGGSGSQYIAVEPERWVSGI